MQSVKKYKLSRRSFFTSALLGTAGFWAGSSNQLSARMLRGLVAETSRGIEKVSNVPAPDTWPQDGITAAWLGHSTVLLNFYGVNILTDPVMFRRVGVDLRLGIVGPKRYVAAALSVHQLPRIDLVLLSHAHMDHFDIASLRCLPASTQAVTAAKTSDLLHSSRMRRVHELPWGQKLALKTPAGGLEVTAFQVKHWGARWRTDGYRGYAGYVLSRGGKKIIFGGDTAFTETFRELRQHGPFEMAIMPIGAYQPWIVNHCSPEQAVRMANAAGADYVLPIHHKTFALGREGRVEPMQRLQAALDPERIGWREIGETFYGPVT